MNKEFILGFISVVLAGIGFGFLGIFGRLAFQSGLSIGELLTARFLIAGILLFLFLLIFNKKLLYVTKKQFLISFLLGFTGYAVFSTLYFKSIEGLSVSLAAMILFTFPILVSLGSWIFLHHKISRKQIFSLFVSTAGLFLLVWGPVFINSFIFILYAFAAAIAYSIYVIVSGQVQQKVHPLSSSVYVILSAGLGLALFHRPSFVHLLELSSNQYFYIFGLSVICTILPITLFLFGLQKMKSSIASIIVTIEPVVAAVAAFFILNENLELNQYVGMILVVFALFLTHEKHTHTEINQ